jgi:hypothetical protein
MNRLRILLITSVLMIGGSALASAQEYHQSGLGIQVRLGSYDRDHDRGYGYYGYRDGDHDRDDRRYIYHNDRGDRDNGWRRDNDDRRGRDWDHDGDRR